MISVISRNDARHIALREASLRRERLQPPLVNPVGHVQILLPGALGARHAPGRVRLAVNAGCAAAILSAPDAKDRVAALDSTAGPIRRRETRRRP